MRKRKTRRAVRSPDVIREIQTIVKHRCPDGGTTATLGRAFARSANQFIKGRAMEPSTVLGLAADLIAEETHANKSEMLQRLNPLPRCMNFGKRQRIFEDVLNMFELLAQLEEAVSRLDVYEHPADPTYEATTISYGEYKTPIDAIKKMIGDELYQFFAFRAAGLDDEGTQEVA